MTEINAGTLPGIGSMISSSNSAGETVLVPFDPNNENHKQLAQAELIRRAGIAAFFGTLQAGFTDLHYLRDIWRRTTEKDALIGVGITGICNGTILPLDLKSTAQHVKEINEVVAKKIGINPASRSTTIKPSGTTSCVVGTSSGIHPWYSEFYIRNIQCAVGDDLYNFFMNHRPELIKVMELMPTSAVISIPQKAPETAIVRDDEDAIDMLERVKRFNLEWVRTGHRKGNNTNNVSATIYVRDEEWEEVGNWMWDNKDTFNGLSVLPFNGGTYKDAPFMEIDEEEFNAKMKFLEEPLDLTLIVEDEDNTELSQELACSADGCEII